jgi:ATP-dependent protease ClpP protease subunit
MVISKSRKRASVDSDSDDEEGCGSIRVINNHVFFYGDIETESIFELHSALYILKEKLVNQKDPEIIIHIMTNGGDIFCGFATYDLLRSFTTIKKTVIVEGCCASAGTLILLAADHRVIRPNAFLLVHNISSTFWGGNLKEFQDEMINMNTLSKKFNKIYKKHTNISEEKLKSILIRDLWFSAKKSKKLGFVDTIE